ncbi:MULTISPECIES: hypothetical protein [Microbispora]|uniref:Uncharacterized protein n=1 Tax=Microbispora hainanensis TaxID=568844 RepID=A0ABZ1STJ3_9ACTN|nr:MULTISPECIES: hypothetical protein [Microbispora]
MPPERYGTQGGDFGAYVAPELAKAAPDNVVGVYIISGLGFPAEKDLPEMTEDERAAYARLMEQDWMNGVDRSAARGAADVHVRADRRAPAASSPAAHPGMVTFCSLNL